MGGRVKFQSFSHGLILTWCHLPFLLTNFCSEVRWWTWARANLYGIRGRVSTLRTCSLTRNQPLNASVWIGEMYVYTWNVGYFLVCFVVFAQKKDPQLQHSLNTLKSMWCTGAQNEALYPMILDTSYFHLNLHFQFLLESESGLWVVLNLRHMWVFGAVELLRVFPICGQLLTHFLLDSHWQQCRI